MTQPILEVVRASKSFGSVKALQDVSLQLRAGEVVCLIGENGAGKSTLMKLLAGVHRPDQGELRIAGRAVEFADPRAALDAGEGALERAKGLAVVHERPSGWPHNAAAVHGQALMGVPSNVPGANFALVPANFPGSVAALHGLNGPQINNLLTAYGLAATGTVRVRRNRLAQHVGVPLSAL